MIKKLRKFIQGFGLCNAECKVCHAYCDNLKNHKGFHQNWKGNPERMHEWRR